MPLRNLRRNRRIIRLGMDGSGDCSGKQIVLLTPYPNSGLAQIIERVAVRESAGSAHNIRIQRVRAIERQRGKREKKRVKLKRIKRGGGETGGLGGEKRAKEEETGT